MSEVAFAINREWIGWEKNRGKRKISIRYSQGSCVLPPWFWCCTYFQLRRQNISAQINTPSFLPFFLGKDVLTAEQQRRSARETRDPLSQEAILLGSYWSTCMWWWGWSLMKQAPFCCHKYPSAPHSSLRPAPGYCQPLAYPHLFSLD